MKTGDLRRLMAFDFGSRRIGVAVARHPGDNTAMPLKTLHSHAAKPDWQAIEALLEEWRPQRLIVGEPVHADGSANPVTLAARRFARQLTGRYRLPVDLVDERLSSYEAASRLAHTGGHKREAMIDRIAACVILETWLAMQEQGP